MNSFTDRWQAPYRMPAVLSVFLTVYILILLGRTLFAAGQSAAWPNEYREAANIQMSQVILSGVNPYSLESLQQAQPGVCYLYGPLLSMIAAFLGLIFPVSMVSIHYALSFLAIVVSAALMAVMVWEHSKTLMAPALAALLMIFCHWRYGYVNGAPDSLGLMLLVLVFFLVTREVKQSGKSFAYDPTIAAAVTVAAFFTKQYFLMVALTAAICYLFISWRRFVQYAIAGIVISAVVFLVSLKFFPLLWTYAIFFIKGPGAGAGMGKSGLAHNTLQVSYLGGMFLMVFLMAFVDFIYSLFVSRRIRFHFSFKGFDTPVIDFGAKDASESQKRSLTFEMMFWLQLALSALVLSYIGRNNGAFISYYLQLFMPALIVVSVCGLDRLFDWNRKWMDPMIISLCFILFFGYTVWKAEPRLIINNLSDEEIASWQEADSILNEALSSGEIYYVPPLAYHGLDNGQYVYNSGQPFVVSEKFYKEYCGSDTEQKLFPHAGEIMEQHFAYREDVLKKIRNGEYALVTDVEDMDVIFTGDDLGAHYEKVATLPLRTGNWTYDVDFWKLK